MNVHTLIIGAGAGGLCMAARLAASGDRDFLILEKSQEVGGTWYDNTYPGAACDVPSHLYSFSFWSNRSWSRKYSPQPEILEYFQRFADHFELRPQVRFGTTVDRASWDEDASMWRVTCSDATEISARVLVCALGQLNRPNIPEIDGFEHFQGAAFHSARWDHTVDLDGRRVGVVGSAASAVQFVPEVAKQAQSLTIFQRSPNWILPRNDVTYSQTRRRAFEKLPGLARLYRFGLYWRLELLYFVVIRNSRLSGWLARRVAAEVSQLANERLPVRALVPEVPMGCKRVLVSDNYYQTLLKPSVRVELSPLASADATGMVTADGVHHDLDVVIFGTGFRPTQFLSPLEVIGREGRRLNDVWARGAYAHRGIAISGFPNLFMLYGPNTNLGHNSILFMIEAQTRYVGRLIRRLHEERLRWIEPDPNVEASYNRDIQTANSQTVFSAGCSSWYVNEFGRVVNNWPSPATAYWKAMRTPNPAEFVVRR